MLVGRTGKSRAFVYAIVLHAIVLVVLVTTTDKESRLRPAPAEATPIVKAHVVDQRAIDEEVRHLKEAEDRKRREAQMKIADAEKKRRAEEQRLKELKKEQARLEQKKAEEKRRITAEKKKLEKERLLLAEHKHKEEQRRKRAEEDKRKAEEEKQRLSETRRKLKQEKARKEAEALREALANEENEIAAAKQRHDDEVEIARYVEAIRTKVASVFIYPDLEGGLNCTLYVRMIPGGEVVEAKVVQSSGNAAFDRQAENAVRKAAPMPIPSDPRLFQRMREIKFVFDPEH